MRTWLESAPRPARSVPCAIETLAGDTNHGEYDLLGYVEIHAQLARHSGAGDMIGDESIGPGPVLHPAEVELARPYACRMGGDAISRANQNESYATSSSDRDTLYAVWARRQH
ncbi:MAG TPA: hypothetical protein VMJ10_26430 [Kofleriaceae bacterium]|nr:hypothetical protein [Kofleriaceae bacterium]